MNAIEILGLTKEYGGRRVVDRLELTVPAGELFALLGVNGAGKSTTIKMLSCLTVPTEGDGRLMGRSVRTDSHRAKEILAVSPQETAIASNLTVRENLELMAGIYGRPKERITQVMEQLDLGQWAKQRAKTLSGGWQRRLSIAMALVSQPEVLFLDEPTLGLDVLARRELWSVIRGLKGHTAIILTTHYLEEAESLADRIGIMNAGRLRAVGTAEELKALAGRDSFEEAFVRPRHESEGVCEAEYEGAVSGPADPVFRAGLSSGAPADDDPHPAQYPSTCF